MNVIRLWSHSHRSEFDVCFPIRKQRGDIHAYFCSLINTWPRSQNRGQPEARWSHVLVCIHPYWGIAMESKASRFKKTDNFTSQATKLKRNKNFSEYKAGKMTDLKSFWYFVEVRFGDRKVFKCPHCGVKDQHYYRKTRRQWRCRNAGCGAYFSATTGTVWQDRKLPFDKIVNAITRFQRASYGLPAEVLADALDVSPKTAHHFLSKLRESIVRGSAHEKLSGHVQVDGGHFAGRMHRGNRKAKNEEIEAYVRQKYQKKNGVTPKEEDERTESQKRWDAKAEAKKKNKRVVMVARQVVKGEGGVKTVVLVGRGETRNMANLLANMFICPGSTVTTDENPAYSDYDLVFNHPTVKHSKEMVTETGVNQNQAESFFSRMRRAQYCTFHGYRSKYLYDYACEFAWREDMRKRPAKEKVEDLIRLSCSNGLSRWWRGYYQGHHRPGEFDLASFVAKRAPGLEFDSPIRGYRAPAPF